MLVVLVVLPPGQSPSPCAFLSHSPVQEVELPLAQGMIGEAQWGGGACVIYKKRNGEWPPKAQEADPCWELTTMELCETHLACFA